MAASKTLEQIDESMEQLHRMLRAVRIIEANQPIGIIKLSETMGIPRHRARYILRLLEHDGVVEPSASGCVLKQGYEEYMSDQVSCLEALKSRIDVIEADISKELRAPGKLFYRLRLYTLVWLGRGVWRALHPKSSICGGDGRGRPRRTTKPIE